MGENLEILEELIHWAIGLLVALTNFLTAVGFLATFVALVAGGGWMLARELFVRLRSLVATEEE
ncbi:MAG: hypothetical protein EDQ89_12170 [Acidobacteria bacterium]|nr:MAG: hypothetical protein EDQ89_12170 [Acidobacteriota bacterium]